jgi:hypothetical protein
MDSEFLMQLIAWLPFLLFVVVGIWIVIRVRRLEVRRALFEAKMLEQQRHQTDILERIARQLEQKKEHG